MQNPANKTTASAAKMIGLLTKLIGGASNTVDADTIEVATAVLNENKLVLRDGMVQKLAKITIAAQKAAKTVNKHKAFGKPNMDKIACLFGYESELIKVYNFFTEADKDDKEQCELIMNLIATIKKMVETGKYDKVAFVPNYPPLSAEEKKELAIAEAKNMVMRITETTNRAIRSINRHFEVGDTEASEWKLRAAIGYGETIAKLINFFGAEDDKPNEATIPTYIDEIDQLKACEVAGATINGILGGNSLAQMDELPLYPKAEIVPCDGEESCDCESCDAQTEPRALPCPFYG